MDRRPENGTGKRPPLPCSSEMAQPKKMRLPFAEIGNLMPKANEKLPKNARIQKAPKRSVPLEVARSNYFMCSQYAADIFDNYGENESEISRRPSWKCMKELQTDLTPNVRAMLVDWMVQVCDTYGFCSDVLYPAVNLVDRSLTKIKLAKEQHLLLGITCIVIAVKYENQSLIRSSLEKLCGDSKSTKSEVLKMEMRVLSELGFYISVPTVNTFLRRYLQFTEASPQLQASLELRAHYLAELSLLYCGFLSFLPSEIAAAAILLAKWMLDPSSDPWTHRLIAETGFSTLSLKECVTLMKRVHQHNTSTEYRTVHLKFQKKLMEMFFFVPELPDDLFYDV